MDRRRFLQLGGAAATSLMVPGALAATARSMARLNRAVEINSMVRVILRMFLIDFRRLSSARALAIECFSCYSRWLQGIGMRG